MTEVEMDRGNVALDMDDDGSASDADSRIDDGSVSRGSGQQREDDRFSISELRLRTDFLADAGVRRIITTIPVRRPAKTAYIRVHPAPEWTLETLLLEIKEASEVYLVARSLWAQIPAELVAVRLCLAVTRDGNPFLLPVRLPGPDGRSNPWHESLQAAIAIAKTRWIRIVADKDIGGYDVLEAQGDLPEPVWPDLDLQEVLDIAFRHRRIDSVDHPVIRALMGKV